MIIKMLKLVFGVLFVFYVTITYSQSTETILMEKVSDHLANGNCDKAQTAYDTWKAYTEKTNAKLESLIQDCKNGKNGSNNSNPGSSSDSNSTLIFTAGVVSFEMVYVAGGTFTMGCTSEQGGDCDSDEIPAHSVTLSSYYMGKFEVTQALWKAVMGNNPSSFKGDNLPVEQVSWEDCQEFIRKLNDKTGQKFRLPTESEWEYAARGGNKSKSYRYSGSNSIDNVAWYYGNSGSTTHAAGTKIPNELGIYDMSGNVWEWCGDWYGSYSSGSQTNPTGASSGTYRVLRGGGWGSYASTAVCPIAARDHPLIATSNLASASPYPSNLTGLPSFLRVRMSFAKKNSKQWEI